jgi:hypothetical protein
VKIALTKVLECRGYHLELEIGESHIGSRLDTVIQDPERSFCLIQWQTLEEPDFSDCRAHAG